MGQAMHGATASSGASSVDVYAQTRADIQTERTYSSIAGNAMKWVPLLNIVLTMLFYALFPVLFPLFLLPGTGPAALRGYLAGFFYLAAWGPLFVILHMMLMATGSADMTAVAGGTGLTLATFTGMADVDKDIGLLAGYLIASVPFLAGGVARGAMAISSHATSYLNPSQNAAEEAAREASTGNISLGNTSLENSSVMTRQFAQGTVAPSFAYGAPQTRTISDSGSVTTSFPDAAYDQLPNSSYPFTPTLGKEFTTRLSTMASEARANSETYANIAQQSTASALTRFHELRSQLSHGNGLETATGQSNSDSIQSAFNEVDQASSTLQRTFGLSRRAADDITTSWFLGADLNVGATARAGAASGSIGAKGGGNRTWTDSDIGIASEDRSRIAGALKQMSDSRNWTTTRDGFVRTVSTSTNTSISSSANGMNSSLTEAQSYVREARRAEEIARRLENQASYYSGNSAAGSLNISQAYREWGLAEIEHNRDFYGSARFDDLSFQLSPQGQALQHKFIESYGEQLRTDIAGKLVLPVGKPVEHPHVIAGRTTQMPEPAPITSHPSSRPDPEAIHTEVEQAQSQGHKRIEAARGDLNAVTKAAKGASASSADDVKKWKAPK